MKRENTSRFMRGKPRANQHTNSSFRPAALLRLSVVVVSLLIILPL